MEMTATIPGLLEFFVNKYRNKLLFQRRDGWSWKQLTWLDCDSEIKNLSSFLLSLDFKPGSYAVIVSSNKIECLFSELAIYCVGGIVVPFSDNESFMKNREKVFSLKPDLLFLENMELLDELKKAGLKTDNFSRVILFDDTHIGKNEKVIPYKGLVKFGQLKKKELVDVLKTSSGSVKSDQAALQFYYKNGTSHFSESILEHQKMLDMLRAAYSKLNFITEEDQSYSYLSVSSPFEKLINLLGLMLGIRLIIAEDMDCFFSDILEAKPTVLFESSSEIEKIFNSFNSSSKSDDLKAYLGGRIKYLITDSSPEVDIENAFRNSGIVIIDLPELSKL